MLLTFAFYFLLSHYQVFKDNRLLYVLVASLIPVKSILYLREQCLTVLGHTIIGKFGNAFLLNSFTSILLISLFLIKGSLGIEHFFIVYATICLIIFMITIFLYQLKVKAKYKDFNWKLYQPKWSLRNLLFLKQTVQTLKTNLSRLGYGRFNQ